MERTGSSEYLSREGGITDAPQVAIPLGAVLVLYMELVEVFPCGKEGNVERTMFSGIACRSWKSWFLGSALGHYNNCLACMIFPVRAAQDWRLQ